MYLCITIFPSLFGSQTSLVGSHACNEHPPGDLTKTFLDPIFQIQSLPRINALKCFFFAKEFNPLELKNFP